MENVFNDLVDYLSMLADKYDFSDKEMNDLQNMIEEIYNGEDEPTEDEPTEDEEREYESIEDETVEDEE